MMYYCRSLNQSIKECRHVGYSNFGYNVSKWGRGTKIVRVLHEYMVNGRFNIL